MRRLQLLSWPALAAAALALAGLLAAGPLRFLVRPCPLRTLSGVPCPTCGGMRATRFLIHGSVGEAFQANPLVAGGLLALAASALAALAVLPWAARISIPPARVRRWVGIVALTLLVLNWIYLIVRSTGGNGLH